MRNSDEHLGAVAAAVGPLLQALLARCQARPDLPGMDVIVDLAVLIANVDGTIDEAEMATLVKTIQALSGGALNERQLRLEVSSSAAALLSRGAADHERRVGESLATLQAGEDGLRLAAAIALASGSISPEERALLGRIAAAAGVPAERLTALIEEISRSLTN